MREILATLTRRFAFREVAFLIGTGAVDSQLTQRQAAEVQQLCAYGQRLFDLDAEDFANADASIGANTDTRLVALEPDVRVPDHLVARGRLCRMRQSPKERPRAALVDLRPAYQLLLEVIAARWARHETSSLLAAAHVASEYAHLLAWQPYLGHAGDPLEIRNDPAFTGPGSQWGVDSENGCSHTRPQRAAAARSLRVAEEPPPGWRAYLDRQHSSVSHALGVCATTCAKQCSVVLAHGPQERAAISNAGRIAEAYAGSALVRLRHAAPVGHGFGVPSPDEVLGAWSRSRDSIAKHGPLGIAVLADDGFPLPGLQSLFSAIAGTELRTDTLIADTAREIAVYFS